MKAIHGNLPVNQAYTMQSIDYNDCYEPCENCSKAITRIAIVKGSNNGKLYRIGLDCAATLTGIIPNEIEQKKKELTKLAKLHKFIKSDCKTIVIGEFLVWLYKDSIAEWSSRWQYRLSPEFYKTLQFPESVKILQDK